MRISARITVTMCALGIIAGEIAIAAAPAIRDWSSDGGNPQHKSDAKDRMYLVRPGDRLTFRVQTEGTDRFQWQVNKRAQQDAAGEAFTWTVPEEKGIWEIHLIATSAGGGETHQEWVVSTLSAVEAPAIFDYFTDGKYHNRIETDPWGRKLPEWGQTDDQDYVSAGAGEIYQADNGYLLKNQKAKGAIFLPSSTVYGTWRIKYQGSLGYHFVGRKDEHNRIQSMPGEYKYSHAGTGFYIGHLWIEGYLPRELFGERFQQNIFYSSYGYPRRYSLAWRRDIAEYGTFLSNVPGWVDLKIIHTPDGAFYFWINGRLMPGTFNIDNCAEKSDCLWFPSEIVDDIEVYREQYLFPPKSAAYRPYESAKVDKFEEIKKGIVIGGRDIRLADIAAMVGDKSLVTYDAPTKTAVCRTNLALEGGAELLLNGETLKMSCATPGELEIRIMEGARLELRNSTITSANPQHYLWRFTSAYHPEYFHHPSGGFGGGYLDSRATLIAKDSTIDHCGFLYLHAPGAVVLENTKLTNLVEAPSGPVRSYNPGNHWPPIQAAFWFKERMPDVPLRSFRNLLFAGKETEPVGIVFEGGDMFGKLNIYDSTFRNAVVEARSHERTFGGQIRDDWKTPAGRNLYGIAESSRTLNLINCKLDKLQAANSCAWINLKYYLDVKAVDPAGKPVEGAKVTVVNEVDDEDHPAENLQEAWEWTCTYGEGAAYHLVPYRKWSDPHASRSTVTGKDGHTPLPADKTGTMILTDCTHKNLAALDALGITFAASTSQLSVNLDLYDDLQGHILHDTVAFGGGQRKGSKETPPPLVKEGQTLHVKLNYDAGRRELRLAVLDGKNLLWDSGPSPLYTTDRSRLVKPNPDFQAVEMGVGRSMVPAKGSYVRWEKEGYIAMHHSGVSSGGVLGAHVDNMKLQVDKLGTVEDNDYSQEPGLTFIPAETYPSKETVPQAMLSYPLKAGTGGKSFAWEFDITLDKLVAKHYAASEVWLKGAATKPAREYTYTVIAEKGDTKTTIRHVRSGPQWHRSDPNLPAYTITAVLDGTTQTEADLVKKGLAGPTSPADGT